MRILIFGAGVCGSVLAAYLSRGGVDVTVLARGQRYEEIKQNGIQLVECQTSEHIEVIVPVITEDQYDQNPIAFDVILAILRHSQVAEALPILAKISPLCSYLLLGNNCSGFEAYIRVVGKERVILGFPNVGGIRNKGVVEFVNPKKDKISPIIVGELDGKKSQRLQEFQSVLKRAKIPVKIDSKIDSFLKSHAAFVIPGADAIYAKKGDLNELIKDKKLIILTAKAIKECVHVLRSFGISEGIFRWLSTSLLARFLRKILSMQKVAEYGMKGHAMAGRDEMEDLEKDFRMLVTQSHVLTPAFDALSNGASSI